MKFTLAPKTMVAVSDITIAELKELEKFNPEALKLKDDKGNDVFVFAIASKGSVGKFGVSFDGESLDGKGFATATVALPVTGVNDTRKLANDIVAPAMRNIVALEEQIGDALLELNECRERAAAAIVIA